MSLRVVAAFTALLFLVVAAWPHRGSARSLQLATGRAMDAVTIEHTKTSFAPGESVTFEIHNRGLETLFYGDGCQPPQIDRAFGEAWLPLVLNIFEALPEAKLLAPGQVVHCQWGRKAWQDPAAEEEARFQSYVESLPVPPGRYRLRLALYASADAVGEPGEIAVVYSPVFTLE